MEYHDLNFDPTDLPSDSRIVRIVFNDTTNDRIAFADGAYFINDDEPWTTYDPVIDDFYSMPEYCHVLAWKDIVEEIYN